MFVCQCGGVISRGALDYPLYVFMCETEADVCVVHLCQVVLTNDFYGILFIYFFSSVGTTWVEIGSPCKICIYSGKLT